MAGFDWVSEVFQIAPALIGQYNAQQANENAAEQVQQANQQASGAVTAGNQAAQARLARLEEAGRPGIDYLRTVVAQDPNTLTVQDKQQLEDARRTAVNQLANTGLRGSGRTVTSALRKLHEGGAGQIIQGNRARQGNAATALSNVSTGATTDMAGIDRSGGASTAGYLQDTGMTNAASGIANANIANSTLGALSGIFAADERNRQREDRYGAMTGS